MHTRKALFMLVALVGAFALTLTVIPVTAQSPGVFYVATNGSSGGNGSADNPWDLQTALLATDQVAPGSSIYVRGGVYGSGGPQEFESELRGDEGNPIYVRGFGNERAIINGQILANGSWTTFWNLEVTNTSSRTASPGQRSGGFSVHGRGNSVINSVIYNTGHPAIGFWRHSGDGAEVYGNIITGAGTYEQTADGIWERGSAIYTQNEEGQRFIRENIIFNNINNGIKMYTEGGYANGYRIVGNVAFNNGDYNIISAGRDNPSRDIVVQENFTYQHPNDSAGNVRLGWRWDQGDDLVVLDNYFVSGQRPAVFARKYSEVTLHGNTLIGASILAEYREGPPVTSLSWDNNVYYLGNDAPFRYNDTPYPNMESWQAAQGFDMDSVYHNGYPTENRVFVRPNEYERGRGHIIAYNWELSNTITADVSSVLQVGDSYEIRDVHNYLGEPILAGTYDGSPVTLPMNLSAPNGDEGFTSRSTSPNFNTFVILCRSCA